ncbi:MAG: hypothetical protein NVV83_12625 [Afipia sp.]|jgi:hypothetical protein|nr:hypothetical protein [Afipia sp.]
MSEFLPQVVDFYLAHAVGSMMGSDIKRNDHAKRNQTRRAVCDREPGSAFDAANNCKIVRCSCIPATLDD